MEGTVYGRRQAGRLGPREIRSKRFARLPLGRRGVDPEEVRRFLGRVAAEVAELRTELAASREEGARLRSVVYQWRDWYAASRQPATGTDSRDAGDAPPNRSRRYDRG